MTSPTFQLVMRAGPNPGKAYTLSKGEIVIGRDVNADIAINTAEVSRRHARLHLDAGVFIVEDLGSTNGTFINGQRLTIPTPLRSGDVIMLGEAATFVYEASQGNQFDPNATMISPADGGAFRSAPVSPKPAAHPPAAPPQTYSGQIPAGPSAPAFTPPVPQKRRENKSWLWAGVGCVVVMLCIGVFGVLLFDMLNLYCTPPFDALFSFLYTCP